VLLAVDALALAAGLGGLLDHGVHIPAPRLLSLAVWHLRHRDGLSLALMHALAIPNPGAIKRPIVKVECDCLVRYAQGAR
jgi:hypothetical protein